MKKNITSFLILFISFGIYAQDSLSLSDAIKLGLERNYSIKLEQRNVQTAQNNNTWGNAGLYPSIKLNLSQNFNITDNIKVANPFQSKGITSSSTLTPSITLDWSIFNTAVAVINKRRLEQLQAESNGNASIVITNTLQAIILGYYNVVLQRQRENELMKQMILSKSNFEYLKIKSNLGVSNLTELLIEETNFLIDSSNFVLQELASRNALRNLNVLLAEPNPDKDYFFSDNLTLEIGDFQFEELKQKLMSDNVDLKKLFLTQNILSYNTLINRLSRVPSVNMNAGLSQTNSTVDLSQALFLNQTDGTYATSPRYAEKLSAISNNYFVTFSVSFNLFNGGQINRAIKNAMVQQDMSNIRIDQAKLSLEKDLSQTLDLYNNRKKIYYLNKKREAVALKNLTITEEKFKSGSINSFNFRTVQDTYLSATILSLAAQYELIDSYIALMRLTGGLVETYNNQ